MANKAIMVVDDSETIRKFLAFALRALGFSVVSARDGMDALEKLSQNKVDLVITEYQYAEHGRVRILEGSARRPGIF